MAPELGRAAFKLGMTITLPGLWLLLFVVHPGSAAFAVTAFTVALGMLFMGVVTAVVRFLSP